MPKNQLCWTCQNACGGCSWSSSLTPVKGWAAAPTRKWDDSRFMDTYHVYECPEYVSDCAPIARKDKHAHFTNEEKQVIVDLYNSGMCKADIARQLHISTTTVRKYVNLNQSKDN